MKVIKKTLLLLTGFIVLVLLALHLLITYRAKNLLRLAVEDISKGAYTAIADEVEFSYLPTGIMATNLKMVPMKGNQQQSTVAFKEVNIKIESVWQILFRKRLSVKLIKLTEPQLLLYAKHSSGEKKKGVAETIKTIQDNLLKAIDALAIAKTTIADASITIYPSNRTDTAEYFHISHIYLDLDHLGLQSKQNGGSGKLHFNGSLRLLEPDIHLLNKNIQVKIGSLHADTKTTSATIDSIDFKTEKAGKSQILALRTVHLGNLHWQRFLDDGVIELDSLVARSGHASIALQKNTDSARQNNASALYQGSSVIIHHTIISGISYNLSTSNYLTKRNPEDLLLMSLEGDSVNLEGFQLVNNRKPPISLDALRIKVRNFSERDQLNNYHFSLDDISIQKEKLTLRNYRLFTEATAGKGGANTIVVPELRLEGYDLEELFQKKLSARALVVENPELLLAMNQKKKAKQPQGAKRNINEVVSQLTSQLGQKVALNEVAINNGAIRWQPANNAEQAFKIGGLSVSVNAQKAIKATNIMDLIHSITRFNTDGFLLTGDKIRLQVKNVRLAETVRGLELGSVEGQFGEGTRVRLYGVKLLNSKNELDIANMADLHISDLKVDSGYIEMAPGSAGKKRGATAKALPQFQIDRLDLNDIRVAFRKGTQTAISARMNIDGTDAEFSDGLFYWKSLGIQVDGPKALLPKMNFAAGSLDVLQPGIIQMKHVQMEQNLKNGQLHVEAPLIEATLGISNSDIRELIITSFSMKQPHISLNLQAQKAGTTPTLPSPIGMPKPVKLQHLSLIQPIIELHITDSLGATQNRTLLPKGQLDMWDIGVDDESKPGILTAKRIEYLSEQPESELKKRRFTPGMLSVKASNLWLEPTAKRFNIFIDTFRLRDLTDQFIGKKADTVRFSIDEILVSNFPFSRGQPMVWQTMARQQQWAVRGNYVSYQTPSQLIYLHKPVLSNSGGSQLKADSFMVKPRLEKQAFWNQWEHEKAYLAISGGHMRTEGLDVNFDSSKPRIHMSKLIVDKIFLEAGKDKTKLEDTVAYRPLPGRQIMQIPIPLSIDSLLFTNTTISASDISKRTQQPTQLYFTDAYGYVANIKTTNHTITDTMDMRVRTRFYGTDWLRLHYRQSYLDSLQGFWMRARMSHFEMKEMDKLLVPLIGLNILSGTVDSLLLVAKGNDYFAYGTMDLRYHALKLKLQKRPNQKGNFVIGIANFLTSTFLRKHDNGRTNLLFKTRMRNRAIFNFWGKISLEGLLTNIGIKSDRKERKNFKKNLDKFKLPDKYWQDDEL